ncbi:MAG: FHA domain-containing protein [Planctomycetaceae bacterium]|nr:FHA domain-containing protein [Planctomycetaceae bacterium]
MDVKLIVASGSKAGQAVTVNVPKFFIGRADDCHLKPRSELVSRYHCALISEEGYVGVRDMKSKNGVFVNGERVLTEKELKNGDRLVVGPLEFTVQLSVSLKGDKKPKVESVKEAVVRTVEVAASQSAQARSAPVSTSEPVEKASPAKAVAAASKPVRGENGQISNDEVSNDEVSNDRSGNEEDGDISDWLMGDDEGEAPETQTIELSNVSDDLKDLYTSSSEKTPDEETQQRVDTQSMPKASASSQKIGDSRDAAANLLKNFFKGGR